MRLAIIGTSITRGYGVPAGHGYTARLATDPAIGAVLNLGRDGATVRRWLPGGPHHGDLDQLAGFAPTHTVIELGANDALIDRTTSDYRAHLIQLAGLVRAKVPGLRRLVLLHTYPMAIARTPGVCDIPPCTPAVPPESWGAYGTAMHTAAVSVDAQCIDADQGWDWSVGLGPDRAHLSSCGHLLLAQTIRHHLLLGC